MSGAVISHCGLYRYRLEREFYVPGQVAAVIMVNPSTADASQDDPTIRRLMGFGARLGWRKLIVGNVFAYRAADVKRLEWETYDPVGPDNEAHLRAIMQAADTHIVAWGPLAKLPLRLRGQWRMIERLAREEGRSLLSWGTAKDGHPRHPLMLSYDTALIPWEAR